MKKLLLIGTIILSLTGCVGETGVDTLNPFREYKVTDTKIEKTLEDGILMSEAENNGLDLSITTAHLVSMVKVGDYATGEVRVIGKIKPEKVEELKRKRIKKVNEIVSYTCNYEYVYSNGYFIWSSNFPYQN